MKRTQAYDLAGPVRNDQREPRWFFAAWGQSHLRRVRSSEPVVREADSRQISLADAWMRSLRRAAPLLCSATLIGVLSGCGGGNPAPDVDAAFSKPAVAVPESRCTKGAFDTSTVTYRSLDGVCTKMAAVLFWPKQSTSFAGSAQPESDPERSQALAAVHARFTWSTFLEWAQTSYPQLFRGSYQDGFYAGYSYRFYPATGHYLGLKDGDKLYALGPITDDEILYVGTLSELLCVAYPANCGPGVTESSDIAGSVSTRASLALNSSYAGTISSQDDQDWFAIDLVAGVNYEFSVEGSATRKGTLSDPFVAVMNSSGTRLDFNDDIAYPNNLNALLRFTPTTSGRYYVGASAFLATGSYLISASVVQGSASGTTVPSTGTPGGATNTSCTLPQVLQNGVCTTLTSSQRVYQTAFNACFYGTPELYSRTYCEAYGRAIATNSSPFSANQIGAQAALSNVGNIGMGQPISATGVPNSNALPCTAPQVLQNLLCVSPRSIYYAPPQAEWLDHSRTDINPPTFVYFLSLCSPDCEPMTSVVLPNRTYTGNAVVQPQAAVIRQWNGGAEVTLVEMDRVARDLNAMLTSLWTQSKRPDKNVLKQAVGEGFSRARSVGAVSAQAAAALLERGFPTGYVGEGTGTNTGGTGTPGGTGAASGCATRPYTGDTSDTQVYVYDYIAQVDQCFYRATGNTDYLTDGDRQCRILSGLMASTNSRFRPQYCSGVTMIR